MTIDQLRSAAKAEPFKPFTVSLADGRRFFVPHPEFVWIPPEASRTFHVAGKGEDESVIDLHVGMLNRVREEIENVFKVLRIEKPNVIEKRCNV